MTSPGAAPDREGPVPDRAADRGAAAIGFEVLPAIDLRGGRVVRLVRGDFGRETAYDLDPGDVARQFAAAGARWIHVVDLDGARSGEPAQLEIVERIVRAAGAPVRCEVAGGLRSIAAVDRAFDGGASRVAVGTAALRDPGFASELVARHGPDRVAVALDVRAGLALGEGWRPGAPGIRAGEALAQLAESGVQLFEATAIDRDGLLGGPDLELLGRLVRVGAGRVIASGGVTSLDDLRDLRAIGCAGAIVGRALYEGRLDLGSAIAAMAAGA
jgi:phosphoribosylformimino-5-aminoimidazole carboxamide ribotide isomerase